MSRLAVAALLAALASPSVAAPHPPGDTPPIVSLPQSFIEAQDGFAVIGDGLATAIGTGGLRWILGTPDGTRAVIDVRPVGGDRDVAPLGLDRLPGQVTSFRGPRSAWRTRATYRAVRYDDLWAGIDLLLEAEGQTVKGTWTVAPGVDPALIRLRHTGADAVTLDAAGRLVFSTPAGELVDDAPLAWQDVDGARREVPVAFVLEPLGDGDADVSFHLGDYDPTEPLLIDPAVIVQAGFLGGTNDEYPWDITLGDDGSVYVAGWTQSADFPALIGPDLSHAGPTSGPYADSYVAKLDPTGTSLVYAGFLGGSGSDVIYGIDVDAAGHLYIGGTTNSSAAAGFPSTGEPNVWSGNYDGFVAKLSVDGSSLDYCGYIGGNSDDRLFGIDVDASGRLYAVGRFQSLEHTLPVHIGPYLSQPGGSTDGFIARVTADGVGLDFCGYLGGDNNEDITDVVADPAGGAWFSGHTWSQDFPVVGALGGVNGTIQGVLGHVAEDGTQLTASGLYGGAGSEFPGSLSIDASGALYVSGITYDAFSFPATVGPSLTPSVAKDGYVARFAPGGGSITWAGFTNTGVIAQLIHDGANAWILSDTPTDDPCVSRIAADGTSYDLTASLPMPTDTGLSVFEKLPDALSPGVDAFWIAGWTGQDETTFPVVSGPDVTANGAHDTVVLRVQLTDGPWTDLGFGLAGTNGVPLQTATGTLGPSSPFTITLSNARANSTTWFVFGLALLQAPFKGGVMLPDPAPPSILLPLLSSPLGEVSFGATWPPGVPSGSSIYTQWWIVDPAGPVGFSASNGLQGTTP